MNDSPVDCQSRDCLTSVARGDRVLPPRRIGRCCRTLTFGSPTARKYSRKPSHRYTRLIFSLFSSGASEKTANGCFSLAYLPPLLTKKKLLSIKSSFFVYPSRRLGISLTHGVRCISSRAAHRPCISSRASVHLTCGLMISRPLV